MYKIIRDNQVIGEFNSVDVAHGVLVCRVAAGDRVALLLAPGQWDSVFWSDDEE